MPFTKPPYFSVLPVVLLFFACSASTKPAALPRTGNNGLLPIVAIDTITPVTDSTHTDAFLSALLQQYPQYFDSILTNRKAYNVQIIYTKVDRGANGIAALKNYYFNVNSNHYFYPAGTVHLPIGILTLQRLDELKATGIKLPI